MSEDNKTYDCDACGKTIPIKVAIYLETPYGDGFFCEACMDIRDYFTDKKPINK